MGSTIDLLYNHSQNRKFKKKKVKHPKLDEVKIVFYKQRSNSIIIKLYSDMKNIFI